MERIAKLRTALQLEVAKHGPLAFYDATVAEVYPDDYTCDITIDDNIINEVRLRALISTNQSIDVLPPIGSAIVVGKLGDDDYIMIACDLIANYRVTVGGMVFQMDEGGFSIGNATESLQKLLTDLVTATLTIAAPKDVATLTALKLRIKTILK